MAFPIKKHSNNNNEKMINSIYSGSTSSRWPESGQHGNGSDSNQNKVSGAGNTCVVDTSAEKPKRKRFNKRFFFAKSLLRLRPSKSSRKNAEDSENVFRNIRGLSKSDENLIRIQVPFNGEERDFRESCVSRVTVEYNPSSDAYETSSDVISYQEKAVDVPEDFVRNQWICRRRWRKEDDRCNSYQESVKSFLREDWICSQTSLVSSDCQRSVSNKNYEINNSFFGTKLITSNTSHQMGAGCSAGCYSKTVAPLRSGSPAGRKQSPPKVQQVKSQVRPHSEVHYNSYSNLKNLNLFDSPKFSSSTIQEDNILHRKNNAFSTKHHSSLLELSSVKAKSKTSPRPVVTDSQSIKHAEPKSGSIKKFGGSVQNLVPLGWRDRGRLKSASENNLNQIPEAKLSRKTNSVVFGGNAMEGRPESDSKTVKTSGAVKKFFELNLPKMKKFKERRKR